MSRARLVRLGSWALAASVLASGWLGCSDVLGIHGLTSPADAGQDASPSNDAASGDSAELDAADATATDAGDAPSPEASPADAGSTDWCHVHAPDAMACQDFDELDAFPPPTWSAVSFGTAGDGGLDDAAYRSPPFGVTIEVPTLQNGNSSQWWLLWQGFSSPSGTTTLTVAFDVRVDEAPAGSGSYVVLGGFVFGLGSGNGASVELLSDANGLHLVQGFGASLTDFGTSTVPLPAPGTWTRLELDLTFDANDGGAWGSASVGGQPVTFDAGAVVTLATLAGYGTPGAGVGNLITLGPTPAQTVHIDDVVVDVHR